MPLMPGSPRPSPQAVEDDGVYRSIFQQPLIEIPPRAPSYAWFEFLLHPDALQRHLAALRQQNAQGAHGATSAIELVREFLDQAQLVADEGNVRNKRYRALLRVAAQVALEMQLSLATIENALPLHFQRLLLDGIVDFTASSSTSNNKPLAPFEAQLLHHRWTLRAIARQATSGFLTASSRSDADELTSGFQLALSDLMATHVAIATSIQATLLLQDTEKKELALNQQQQLSKQTQLDAFVDLGVYFFSFSGYEKAYECFSRAAELGDEYRSEDVAPADADALEGYLAACEAVLEARSLADDAQSQSRSPRALLDSAVDRRAFEDAIALLDADLIAQPHVQLTTDDRQALERRAQRLLLVTGSSDNDSGVNRRSFYTRVALLNALHACVQPGGSVDASVRSIVQLLYGDVLDSAIVVVAASNESTATAAAIDTATRQLDDAAQFVLQRIATAHRHYAANASVQSQLQMLLERVVRALPALATIDGAAALFAQCSIAYVDASSATALSAIVATEVQLVAAANRQRVQLQSFSDLTNVFPFAQPSDCDALLAALRHSDSAAVLAQLPTTTAADAAVWRNLLTLCMVHSCWDVLLQWRDALVAASIDPPTSAWTVQLHLQLEFAVACGALVEYVRATDSTSQSTTTDAFSIVTSNKLVADVLLQRRQVLESLVASDGAAWTGAMRNPNNDDAEELETTHLLLELPLRVLETLVCVAAGLLHRASMRNVCAYRISFELTPYGDVAFRQAFAPSSGSTDHTTTDGSTDATSSYRTTPFIESYQTDLVALHSSGLACLAQRCAREPRWHCARADMALNPIGKQKLSATSDPLAALRGYLVAASLATNFFADATSVVDIIDQSSLVRLSQCLVKVGAHVAAAVLYQCFATDEFKYGLRILQIAPETHDDAFFQYFWELPFLELLMHLHAKRSSSRDRVSLLTQLLQSPELNASNPPHVLESVKQRILRCYFRDLCRLYLSSVE